MDRKTARACAMKLVYEWEMGGDGGEDTLCGILEVAPDDPEREFVNKIFEGVKNHREELDTEISKWLKEGWTLTRISNVDHAILLVAVYEMTHTDLSGSIVINEAVDLANTYSADKAGAFVNGVLGNLYRSRENA